MAFDLEMVVAPPMRVPGYTPQDRDRPERFQCANRVMRDMVDVMTAAGVLDIGEAHRELPQWPPEGISPARIKALGAELFMEGANCHVVFTYPREPSAREAPLFDDWAERTAETLCRPSASPGRVPACKFQSHSGWMVTPAECRWIAEALEREMVRQPAALLAPLLASKWPATKAGQWIRDWTAYHRVAQAHGGYRVR